MLGGSSIRLGPVQSEQLVFATIGARDLLELVTPANVISVIQNG